MSNHAPPPPLHLPYHCTRKMTEMICRIDRILMNDQRLCLLVLSDPVSFISRATKPWTFFTNCKNSGSFLTMISGSHSPPLSNSSHSLQCRWKSVCSKKKTNYALYFNIIPSDRRCGIICAVKSTLLGGEASQATHLLESQK